MDEPLTMLIVGIWLGVAVSLIVADALFKKVRPAYLLSLLWPLSVPLLMFAIFVTRPTQSKGTR